MKFYSLLPLAIFLSVYLWTSDASVTSTMVVCDIVVDAGPDTSLCSPGGIINLIGSFTGDGVAWEWTPSPGISDPNSLATTANVTDDIVYTLTVYGTDPGAADLVINGDFEQGNMEFTGNYTYVMDDPLSQGEMWPEGTYTVVTNPNFVHTGFAACSDHTTGSGNMIVVNGAANLQDIWCQTITVNPGTYYNFAAWVASVNPSSPAQLQFSINGSPIGSIFNASSSTCLWQSFNALWNSENTTIAEICILNLNTQPSGNDFALDDISFYELCSAADDVTISIIDEPAPEPMIEGPDLICPDDIHDYSVSQPDSPAIISYTWSVSPGGTIVDGQGTPSVSAYWNFGGDSEICLEIETRCSSNSSCFPVTVYNPPGNITVYGPFEVCQQEIATYYVTENPLFENYLWEIPPGATLLYGQNSELIEIQWGSDGFTDLCLTVNTPCGDIVDCVPVEIHPTHLVIIDTAICAGNSFDVNGTSYGNGNNQGVEITVSHSGCDSTIEITVQELDVLETVQSIVLCRGDSVWLEGAFQNTSGTYTDNTMSTQGCDSMTITSLIINDSDTQYISVATCIPADAGITSTSFPGSHCDSVIITEKVLMASDSNYVLLSSCNTADTGVFVTSFTNISNCDSIVTTVVRFALSDSTFLITYSCEVSDTGISYQFLQNKFGCDSIVRTSTKLAYADTVYFSNITCEIQDTGIQIINLLNAVGCDSINIYENIYVGSEPTYLINTSCEISDTGITSQLYLNSFGCDSLVTTTTSLLPHEIVHNQASTCIPSEAGEHIEIAINEFGCYDTIVTSTLLLPVSYCEITYETKLITRCISDPSFIEVSVSQGTGPFDVSWKHENEDTVYNSMINQLHEPDSLFIDREGTYIIIITWASDKKDTSYINVDFPDPIDIKVTAESNFSGYALACYDDSDGTAELQVLQEGTAPLNIKWSRGDTTKSLTSLTAGVYTVTVTDSKGCTATDSVVIDQPPAISFTLKKSDISCFGQMDGSIEINSISGGIPDINTWIRDLLSPSNSMYNLGPGVYPVSLIDQNGCAVHDTIQLNEPNELKVELNPDTTIQYGSSFLLEAQSNNSYKSITWDPNICSNCAQIEVSPLVTTTYFIEIQDSAGCVASTSQTINVVLEKNIYAPNVFSPNGDGINDYFFLSCNSSVVSVRKLEIFDRWGNLVFLNHDLIPGQSDFGWDGIFRGSEVPAGVYVYTTQVEYVDGSVEFLKGDLTLIR